MSFVAKVLPFAVVAAGLVSACSDVSSPSQAFSVPTSSMAKKGGGGGGGESVTQLVVATPPTANVTGRWVGTDDRNDAVYTYTYTLTQTDEGIVSGVGITATPTMTATASIVGTVNGDTLMLAVGSVSCGSCTITPIYRGIISSDALRVNGSFLSGGSPVTLVKQ